MAAEAKGRAMTRMLIAIFEGDEGRGLVQVTRLIGLGRLQNAAVRVAYFHSIPRDRTDRHDRIVSDRFREMLRIEEAMREAVTGLLRAAGRAPVECVVRFGTPEVAMAVAAPSSWAQPKKLVFWTHWEQNPEFNKFYETRGKDFGQKTGYEVQVVTVPYQGYEAKYLAALMGKSGAPDIFMGMTHHWCGQYDFCDKMPADLAKIWDENLPKYIVNVGRWKGVRYGIPIEHGNFQQMYIDTDLFKKAVLDPDRPPTTLDAALSAMKKPTVPGATAG